MTAARPVTGDTDWGTLYEAYEAVSHNADGTLKTPLTFPYVSVADYGASGDDTDQTAAIQACLAAVTSGIVYVPAGNYKISSTLSIPAHVCLRGSYGSYGGGGAIFKSNVNGLPCFKMGSGTAAVLDTCIENIAIQAGTYTNGIGIQAIAAWKPNIKNVSVSGFVTGTGIQLTGDTGGGIATIQPKLENIYFSNNLVNLHLTGKDTETDSSTDEGMFDNIRINLYGLANSKGIFLEKGYANVFIRTSINDSVASAAQAVTSGTVGVYFDDGSRTHTIARDNMFISTAFEYITTGIHFESATKGNVLDGIIAHVPQGSKLVNDLSGGGNTIRRASGGYGLGVLRTVYPDQQSYQNLLSNAEFERWEASVSAAPTGWTLTNGSCAREATIVRKGTYSAAITRDATNVTFAQAITPYAYLKDRWISFGCWVYSAVGNGSTTGARLQVLDGVATTSGKFHSGVAGWEFLVVRHRVSASATYISCYIEFTGVAGTIYVDQAIVVEGRECPLPVDKPLLDSNRLANSVSWTPGTIVDGAGVTKSIPVIGAAFGNVVMVGAPYDLVDCTVCGYVQAADAVEIRLQNESGAEATFGAGTWKVQVLKV